MTDRHKNPPRAVRMPGGLEAWYRQRAEETGKSVNALIVTALEEHRARHDSGTTAPVAAPVPERDPETPADPPGASCTHPKAKRLKGRCTLCKTFAGFD